VFQQKKKQKQKQKTKINLLVSDFKKKRSK